MDIKKVIQHYTQTGSIKSTARQFGLNYQTCRRLLISAGVDVPGRQKIVKHLREEGYNSAEIAQMLRITRKAVECYKSYSKGSYVFDVAGDSNIKNLRLALGMSQRELAKKAGISQYALSAWERGKVRPRTKNLKSLAIVLNCKVEDLM